MLLVNFAKFSRTHFFIEHLVAASENLNLYWEYTPLQPESKKQTSSQTELLPFLVKGWRFPKHRLLRCRLYPTIRRELLDDVCTVASSLPNYPDENLLNSFLYESEHFSVKGKAMQIEKALIYDRLRVSKVPKKFCIRTNYNFSVIHPWKLIFS